MLGSLLHLYDSHPHEDVSTLALIVLGTVKAAAVLKTVRLLFVFVLCFICLSVYLPRRELMQRG